MDLCGCPTGDRRFPRDWRRSGDASVELAVADAVRMAANYLLAGVRTTGSVPDSVRRLGWSRRSSLQFSTAHGREVGAHDARGAREVPPGHALSLQRLYRSNQRIQGASKFLIRALESCRRTTIAESTAPVQAE